jgi:hypothetical protein
MKLILQPFGMGQYMERRAAFMRAAFLNGE